MTIAILADQVLKEEWLAKPTRGEVELVWADSLRALAIIDADAYVDLLFVPDQERIEKLKGLLSKPVLVSFPADAAQVPEVFIGINTANQALKNNETSLAVHGILQENTAKAIFNQLGWNFRISATTPLFITGRNLILSIDTAIERAGICLADGKEPVAFLANAHQKDHASWIHNAIRDVLAMAGAEIGELKAVAVTAGPGSYTGLRVGMATAKGLCYALKIPMITENTLRVMAFAVRQDSANAGFFADQELPALICPMIDARRMEVFTALFDIGLQPALKPSAMVLDELAFSDFLTANKIIFAGNGSGKWQRICVSPNAFFSGTDHTAVHLAQIAYEKFIKSDFSDLAYTEPQYLKDFYMVPVS